MKAARTRALNAKHAGSRKHGGTGKHTPSASKKTATAHAQKAHRTAAQVKAAKARALGSLPCCVAEAVAASARLAGWRVPDAATLELFARTDGPSTIPATLEAAYRYGIAGLKPLGLEPVSISDALAGVGAWRRLVLRPQPGSGPSDGAPLPVGTGLTSPAHLGTVPRYQTAASCQRAGLILGLELPEGPHAVTWDPAGDVWSWGGLYELTAEALVEEAWAVVWP